MARLMRRLTKKCGIRSAQKIRIAIFSLFTLSSSAFAADSDWQDGVFTGDAAELFAGQSPEIIAFVKAHSDLARDGQVYLSPCPNDGSQQLCNLNQTRFILDYIAAFYGDHDSQQNVGYSLSGDGMPPKLMNEGNMQVGVSPDPVWGCAWRIATLTSGNAEVNSTDLTSYKDDCETLSPEDQDQAFATATGFLVQTIHNTMASGKIPYDLADSYPQPP